MAILHFTPTYVSDTDDHGVGNVFFDKSGKAYKWVEVVDLDLAISYVVYPASLDGTQVTCDYTGGSAKSARVIGVSLGAVDISVAKYAFIQVQGVVDTYGDGSVAAGDPVIGHSTDGMADTMADGEEELVFGFALEADDGSPVTFACQLTGCL